MFQIVGYLYLYAAIKLAHSYGSITLSGRCDVTVIDSHSIHADDTLQVAFDTCSILMAESGEAYGLVWIPKQDDSRPAALQLPVTPAGPSRPRCYWYKVSCNICCYISKMPRAVACRSRCVPVSQSAERPLTVWVHTVGCDVYVAYTICIYLSISLTYDASVASMYMLHRLTNDN